MTFDHARALRARQLLQLRLERRRQSGMFREVAPLLCDLRQRPRKLPPVVLEPLLAFLASVPGRDERIYWAEVPGSVRVGWELGKECADTISSAADALGIAGERLALVFHPAEAGLLLRGTQLLAAWPALHDRLYGTIWIVSVSDPRRLIEVSFVDRETCFSPLLGRSEQHVDPLAPEGADGRSSR